MLGLMNTHYLINKIKRQPKESENDCALSPFTKLSFNGMYFNKRDGYSLKDYYKSRMFRLTASDLMYLYFYARENVGHRVLHGGEKYSKSVVITDEVVKDIEDFNLIGLGWLPCLYAKSVDKWNEADRFVDFAFCEKWHRIFFYFRKLQLEAYEELRNEKN